MLFTLGNKVFFENSILLKSALIVPTLSQSPLWDVGWSILYIWDRIIAGVWRRFFFFAADKK